MKIQILSDLHIEFEEFMFESTDSDLVVVAGDVSVRDKGLNWIKQNIHDKPVLYILGNHEFYGKAYPKLINDIKEAALGSNVHILEKDVMTIGGINFLGCTLWTDFQLFGNSEVTGHQCEQIMTDFKKIRVSPRYRKLRSSDLAVIHHTSVAWLKQELASRQGEKNIVITHHGPSRLSLPVHMMNDVVSAAYVSELTTLIEEYAPGYWLHGHLHNSSDYMIGNCKVICNPRGYPDEPNPDFRPDFYVEV